MEKSKLEQSEMEQLEQYNYAGKGIQGLMGSYRHDVAPFITKGELGFGDGCFGNGVMGELASALFPRYFSRARGFEPDNQQKIGDALTKLGQRLYGDILVNYRAREEESQDGRLGVGEAEEQSRFAVDRLLDELGGIREMLKLDAEAAIKGDPAAKGYTEIIRSYPGFRAIMAHRIAHVLYGLDVPYYPRELSEEAHARTGIDIHPGASIAEHFFIDHGTGVVIGETTVIGKWVRIYQGVTLGALSLSQEKVQELKASGRQRHPTIEDKVIIYAGATILGGRTVIGEGSVIGGNVWITEPVEAGSIVFLGELPHQKIIGKEPAKKPEEQD
jgi:serine O-acetyltransferase